MRRFDAAMAGFADYGLTFVPPIDLVPGRTALLVIDMQYMDAAAGQGYSAAIEQIEPGSSRYYDERIESTVVPALRELIPACRARGVRVVYLRLGSMHRDYRDLAPRLREFMREVERRGGVPDLLWAGNELFEIRHDLAPQDGDVIVDKTTFGAFSGSALDDELKRMGIDSLIVTGVSTATCVESTAREAADRGYGVVIVDECTADYDPDAQTATLRAFHFNFGRVVETAGDAIEMIQRPAGSDGV
jgi:biuret amidohydrolase